jgi:DNA-binding response OmpR family regulator
MSVATAPAKQLLILVIEDNQDTADGLARFLRIGCGFGVITATDGVKGLHAALNDRPDVVLCDLGLPKRNGLLVGEEILAALDPRPLLIAITGYGDTATRELARTAGFHHFLVKPADPFEIEALIQAHFAPAAEPVPDEHFKR